MRIVTDSARSTVVTLSSEPGTSRAAPTPSTTRRAVRTFSSQASAQPSEATVKMATPGKRLCGLYVTDADGHRLSFIHALGRNLAALLSYLTLYIGFFMAGFTAITRNANPPIQITADMR